jgi:hypothetical protein
MEYTSQQPEAATTFELFPRLPPELRLLAWSFAIPKQRVVEICHHNLPFQWNDYLDPLSPLMARGNSIPLLSVCQESHTFVLKSYNLGFLLPIKIISRPTPKSIALLFCVMVALQWFCKRVPNHWPLWTSLKGHDIVWPSIR